MALVVVADVGNRMIEQWVINIFWAAAIATLLHWQILHIMRKP